MERTAVITGGTGGIGQHTAIGLARAGYQVLVIGRDAQRGEAARRVIVEASGNQQVEVLLADMADLGQVHDLADEVARRLDHLDVLVNNAGAINHDNTVTTDGIELAFAVNVVAPHQLTVALRPLLRAADRGRVVNVTGGSPRSRLRTDKLNDPSRAAGLKGYSNAKRALEAVSLHLADELSDDGTSVAVVYPGGASTAMTGRMTAADFPFPMSLLAPLVKRFMVRDDDGRSAARAARSSIAAAMSPDLTTESPTYLKPSTKQGTFPSSVTDPDVQQQVIALVRAAIETATANPHRAGPAGPSTASQ